MGREVFGPRPAGTGAQRACEQPHSVHELIARIRAVVRRDDDSEISEGVLESGHR
jgi:DNA-binding response OmpR family regulator